MSRLISVILVVVGVVSTALGLLGINLLDVITKAASGDSSNRLVLSVVFLGLTGLVAIAVMAISLLESMKQLQIKVDTQKIQVDEIKTEFGYEFSLLRNDFGTLNNAVDLNLKAFRQEFVERQLSVFEEVFDSVNEIYSLDQRYEGKVYRKLIEYIQSAENSIIILTVPGVGDAEIANKCKPMNCEARKDYFVALQNHILLTLKKNKKFRYDRIHQVPVGKDASHIEMTSRTHCSDLFQIAKGDARFEFRPRYIANQRNTGFIIIDDEVLILLVSGFAEEEQQNMQTPPEISPQFVPYIMSIQVFMLRSEFQPKNLIELIEHHKVVFNQVFTKSKPMRPDDPSMPSNKPHFR